MGINRLQYQTPYEYARHLRCALPEMEHDIDDLTDVFVHARYSLHQVDGDQATKAVTHSQRVQQALQQL